MNRTDRETWAAARTLADAGELTARWVEGAIASQPGYCGPSDIEDPALVPLLARLNRAGFVTTGSQAGASGGRWEQRAAVEGFADSGTTAMLGRALRDTGAAMIRHHPASLPRWRYGYDRAWPVTLRDGDVYTRFGVQVPRRHIRSRAVGYGACHRDAVRALCGAWQVTIIDPAWGRRDLLWDVLDGALPAVTS